MKTRKVTLKDENGAEYSFIAEPSVKNLAQLKPGDVVTSTYTESVAYVVKNDGGAPSMSASQGMTTAPAGEKPGAVATSKTTVTVVVTAIDAKAASVTFKGPQGNTHTVKVQDPEKLEGVKVGDTVDVTYTEALSIKVHTPKKM
jgi:ribosomal protein S17